MAARAFDKISAGLRDATLATKIAGEALRNFPQGTVTQERFNEVIAAIAPHVSVDRDGALAERERIVALLRAPTEADIDWFADIMIEHGSPAEDDVRSVLRALSDSIAAEGKDDANG